jgi:serine/threonine-protein kinase
MIKCKTCGTENLNGAQFCDECGANLESPANYKQSPPPVCQPLTSDPSLQVAGVTSIGIEPIAEQTEINSSKSDAEPKAEGVHAQLVIERGEAVGKKFMLTTEESHIGRWDADNGIFPDIDLDAFDPEAKVSRRHARIIFRDGKYFIEDLGSTNGTYVNRGRRLIPGTPHPLNDGDEIIVGKTFLRFTISR